MFPRRQRRLGRPDPATVLPIPAMSRMAPHPTHRRPAGPHAVGGVVALMLFSLIATALGHRPQPSTIDAASTGARRLLVFKDRADGAVLVFDADPRPPRLIDVVLGQSGFLRGVLRGFASARRALGIGSEPPLRLLRLPDGKVRLNDPSTGRSAILDAFGPDNAAAFIRYLPAREPQSAFVQSNTARPNPGPRPPGLAHR